MYKSSVTGDASSTNNSATAEKPRTVASVPGKPTIRDPFGKASEISLSPLALHPHLEPAREFLRLAH